jgi:hypothetical protein
MAVGSIVPELNVEVWSGSHPFAGGVTAFWRVARLFVETIMSGAFGGPPQIRKHNLLGA